jgi:hypothetical protein
MHCRRVARPCSSASLSHTNSPILSSLLTTSHCLRLLPDIPARVYLDALLACNRYRPRLLADAKHAPPRNLPNDVALAARGPSQARPHLHLLSIPVLYFTRLAFPLSRPALLPSFYRFYRSPLALAIFAIAIFPLTTIYLGFYALGRIAPLLLAAWVLLPAPLPSLLLYRLNSPCRLS